MKIVTAKFTDNRNTDVFGVYQWSYGQVLRIEGLKLPKMVEIHFSLEDTGGEALTRIGTTKDGVTDVVIPDSLLENEGATGTYKIYAWVYLTDTDSGSTEYKITIHVKARSKPEIPGGGDNQDVFHEAVLAVRESAEKAEEAQRQAEGYAHGREDLPECAEDNAMYYAGKTSEDAKKTAEDRKEVERLVESVSGIDEQVAKVEKLSKDAQEAATQAGTSAGQAEEYKKAAETASRAAQTAAQETEADRTSVEKAKTEVENLSAQVQKNKESVDKTTQDFTLTAQQALADVNNAGQTQTERVQTAGTTAVENIKTAQGTATQAIETAKIEAVKAVQTEGTTQIGKVTVEGEKQVQAVQTAAQEIIADREQIQKNTTDIAELRQKKADAIVNTVSGTLLNVKDSAEAFVENLIVHGKTEQIQTTGANLFDDKQLLDENNLNYDKTLANTGIWWFKIPASETVTISVKNKNTKSDCYLVVSEKMGIDNGSNSAWLTHPTVPLKDSATINPINGNIWLGVNTNIEKIREMLEKVGGIMLNAGSAPKTYEPYTGGKPSPSPEYPQPVVNAGRLNEDTGKYEVDVKVTGKNLFDKNKMKVINANLCTTEYHDDIIKITSITDNSKSAYAILTNNLYLRAGITYHVSGDIIGNTTISPSFCFFKAGKIGSLLHNSDIYTPENDEYVDIGVYLAGSALTGKTIELTNIRVSMINKEDYEPYKEQTITLTSDRPLTKWDRLVEQDGQIWWLYKGKQYIVTGEESLRIPADIPGYIYGNTTSSFLAISNNDFSDKKGYLNKLAYIPMVWVSQSNEEGYCLNGTNQLHVRFANNRLNIEDTASISEREKAIKAHIKQQYDAGTPYILWYESLQAEFVPLPQEQQSAIRALQTYYPTTVVSNSEDVEMELSYVADTKNYTDRKIEEAVSAQTQNLALLAEEVYAQEVL